MNLSNINKKKIEDINKGLWTVNRYEFYVEIEIKNTAEEIDGQIYYRLLHQNELTAIETQIIISKLINNEDEKDPYKIFDYHYQKMKQYQKVVEFLNLQGITEFESFKKKYFDSFEAIFNKKFIYFQDEEEHSSFEIYQNPPKTKFLTDNIQYSAIRIIGQIIQQNKDVYIKLNPYVKCFLGQELLKESFDTQLNKFIEKQSYDVLFDPFKLGSKFCQYFLTNNKLQFTKSVLKNKTNIKFDFDNKLIQCFDKNNLLFLKTIRPSHCYHCIRSITRIITNYRENSLFYLNEKTLIFCNNDGDFVGKIEKIIFNKSNLTYFIVHPEMLNEENHSFLVEFLNTRMNSLFDINLPKIIIISSLDYRTFFFKNLQKFNDIEIEISKEIIEHLYELSYPDQPSDYCYQLYYSDNAGSGKTYQIIQDFKNNENCIPNINHVLKSLFVDISMKKLPKLEYVENDEIKEYRYVHLDLSPELFDNNYRFFDNLWTFTILHYQINSDGTNSTTPPNIFFEVPTLTKKQFPDGGFINKYDFPIYCNYYHKISLIKNPIQIQIPHIVKQFCDIIFKDKINSTFELLQIALKMFFPNNTFNESCFVPRILEKINIFMEYFCKNLSLEDNISKIIFILLLRTNFHVWNMENLFKEKSQPKSFIIISNENLFSNKFDPKKWILLCFSSFEEKNLKWNIKFLKRNITNIEEIEESNIFRSKLFNPLLSNPNINVFTNHRYFTNYENDQSYFFSIIKAFFYHNADKENLYRKITDGVILYNFKNNDTFEKDKVVLPYILDGPKIYKQNREYTKIHKWTRVFDTLQSIFADYKNEDSIDLVFKLANDIKYNETIKQISNITLTMTIVKRFVIMILRIILKQPLILEGFTGVGKTWCVTLLKKLIEIAERNKDFEWVFHQIDCHDALQLNEMQKMREDVLKKYPDPDLNHIFFFDELNTSPVSNYIINKMTNYYLKRENLQKNNFSIVFIAAINPYIKIDKFSRNLSRVGIQPVIPNRINKLNLCCITPKDTKNLYEITNLNELAYNVRKLSDSAKIIILKSDPELFNEGDLKIESSIYLPSDEIKTIDHIIDYYLKLLIAQTNYYLPENLLNNSKKIEIKDNERLQLNLETIEYVLTKHKNDIQRIILSLLCKSFLEIRELMCLKSILSFRDVKRTMQFFILFFTKLIKVYLRKDGSPDIDNSILYNHIIPQSIVLSIMISIVFRFSNETKLETVDGRISKSREEEEKILARCAKFGLKLSFSKDRTYYVVGIRSVLLKKLVEVNVWPYNFAKPKTPEDWYQIVISYSWLKCFKYIYAGRNAYNNNNYNSNLFKLNSLMINLFSISSCYSASKNNQNSVIPCMIIGMPGTSKTLAIQLFTDYKQTYGKSKNKFLYTTYLSTRVSESEGFNSHYRDCAMFMIEKHDYFSVCVIDELGLANLNETRPLKLLHYYFDKGIRIETKYDNEINVPVMPIAVSNYALDYANMNRGVLVCADLPSDKEIAEAFYFSQLEESKTRVDEEIIKKYKNEYFSLENNFFDWKKDPENKIATFKNFLEILWSFTDKKERPDMLTLRPLFLLFNSIFHNWQSGYDHEIVNNLCLYLISAIKCKPSDSFSRVKALVYKLFEDGASEESIDNANIRFLKQILNEQNESNFITFKEIFIGPPEYDNYKILKQSIISPISKRALCFRTKYYECLDFVEELLRTTTIHYLKKKDNDIEFVHFYPNDFKNPKQISNDNEIEKLLEIIRDNNQEKLYYILIVGNVSLTDSLLDLLNSPSEGNGSLKTKKPLISKNGFSVELDEFPKNITFCFIINESDFQNKVSIDSFPIPLLNRLNQITLDYNQRDEFGIIEKYKKYHDDYIDYSTPYATIIHEYFNRFVDNLKDVPKSSYEKENSHAIVYATTKIDRSFYEIAENEGILCIFDLHDDFDTINWDKKIILSLFNSRISNIEAYRENIDKFAKIIKEGKKSLTLFWSKEFCQFYQIAKNHSGLEIPLPKPDNYDVYLDNDGSISNLIEKIERKEINLSYNSKQVTNRAIIVTTSPLMENIILKQLKGITVKNTEFLFDQCISSAENLYERIIKINKENIIIQLNHFQIEHDRYLRYLLENLDGKKYTIIIYHIKYNIIPEGLYTSLNWPVFWIESITDSPLSIFKTNEIVECILFKEVFKERMGDLYHRIFRQVYNDIDSHFEDHIDNNKVDEILNFIFMKLKEVRNKNGELVLEAINFNDLIDKFEGKTIKDSYKNFDFKREFYNTIINQIPHLTHIIQVLILNHSVINENSISDTKVFISNLFKVYFEELFKIADLYYTSSLYFPEFIIPQVRSIYEVYKEGTKIFKKLYNIQIDSRNDYLENLYHCYLVSHFSDKLREIIIDMEYKIKQENEIIIIENARQKEEIILLTRKTEEMNVQLANKIKEFDLQLEIKAEENKNLTRQIIELNKKNEDFEIIKKQNIKIKQENEEQKEKIDMLMMKSEELNAQLASKIKEFNLQLKTKAEENKNLTRQIIELNKKNEDFEIIKNQNIKIKQENAEQTKTINVLAKKAKEQYSQLANKTRKFNLQLETKANENKSLTKQLEELNSQLANKTKEFNLQLETKEEENKNLTRQIIELNKKNEDFEIIKNQNAKIKQENAKQKKEISILTKKAEELNVQLANKIKEFDLQLETKEEENKNLTKQLEELNKKNEDYEIINNQNAKIKQENAKQKKEISILTKKAEELNVQLANKIKEFDSQFKTKTEENKNLTKQLEELNKKNEYYETINNQNAKIKQENEILIKENAKQKKDINILTKKAKELNLQLENKTKEFNSQLKIKTEKLKKLQKQLDDLLKQSNDDTIKILDSNTINNLEIIEEIGYGGGGKVLKVAMKEPYALKVMNVDKNSNNSSSLRNFLKEYEIMNMLNHPNILKTYGIFLSDEKNPPSILLEFCPMNLNNALKNKKLSKVEIICSIYQIVEGMKYVHFRKIIHRDLKPTNILIAEDGKIRIGDFGIATLMSADQQLTTGGLGTQKFMAPEIINEENYNEKADVYSFGVLVYTILNDGKLPVIKIRDICIGKKAAIPPNFTVFSKNLINACWNFEPDKRPSFEMILNDLDRNKYNLIKMTKLELSEVENFVKKHKSLIPNYSKV